MAPSLSQTQVSYASAGLLSTPLAHRLDGRSLLAFRPLRISSSFSPQAAGSASCTLGGGGNEGTTRCSAVISADVVQGNGVHGSGASSFVECAVDVDDSIGGSVNLHTLIVTLQRALSQAVEATFNKHLEQFVILRSANAPHSVVKAWKLHVDVMLHDVSGGNVADVLFASVYAAFHDVRLPQTRAIGFDVNMLHASKEEEGAKVDIFNVRGPVTGGVRGEKRSLQQTARQHVVLLPSDSTRIGVDFEIRKDVVRIENASAFPIGVTVNVLGPQKLLLDATQIEEACLPYTRRIFVLCKPASAKDGDDVIVGTHMLTASFETGANQLGEERIPGRTSNADLIGTCDFHTVQQAVRQGHQYAQGLHSAIQAQLV